LYGQTDETRTSIQHETIRAYIKNVPHGTILFPVLEPYGYVAVSSLPTTKMLEKKPADYQFTVDTHRENILAMGKKEKDFFVENYMGDLVFQGQATSNALVKRVDSIFSLYLTETWIPKTLRVLTERLEKLEVSLFDLGTPDYTVAEFCGAPADIGRKSKRECFVRNVEYVLENAFVAEHKQKAHEQSMKTHDDIVREIMKYGCNNDSVHVLVNGWVTASHDNNADAYEYTKNLLEYLQSFFFDDGKSNIVSKIRELWLAEGNKLLKVLMEQTLEEEKGGYFKIQRFHKFVEAVSTQFGKIVEESIVEGNKNALACLQSSFLRPSECIQLRIQSLESSDNGTYNYHNYKIVNSKTAAISDSNWAARCVNVSIHADKIANELLNFSFGESTFLIRTQLKATLETIMNTSISCATRFGLSSDEEIVEETQKTADSRKMLHREIDELESVRVNMLKEIAENAIVALQHKEPLHDLYVQTLEKYGYMLSGAHLPTKLLKILKGMEVAANTVDGVMPLTDGNDVALLEVYKHLKLDFILANVHKDESSVSTRHARNCVRLWRGLPENCDFSDANASWINDFAAFFKGFSLSTPLKSADLQQLLNICSTGLFEPIEKIDRLVEDLKFVSQERYNLEKAKNDVAALVTYQQLCGPKYQSLLELFALSRSPIVVGFGVFKDGYDYRTCFENSTNDPRNVLRVIGDIHVLTIEKSLKLTTRKAKSLLSSDSTPIKAVNNELSAQIIDKHTVASTPKDADVGSNVDDDARSTGSSATTVQPPFSPAGVSGAGAGSSRPKSSSNATSTSEASTTTDPNPNPAHDANDIGRDEAKAET
jgi:hypothetical protein